MTRLVKAAPDIVNTITGIGPEGSVMVVLPT